MNSESEAPDAAVRIGTPAMDCWSLVLAGGDGSRMRQHMTAANGEVVPKQYCTINRELCLVQDSLKRSLAVAPAARNCIVVASQHERWWKKALTQLSPSNVFVQPANRGTAFGLLLGLVNIERQADARAPVLVLPADHFVSLESVMAQSIKQIVQCAAEDPNGVFFLGAEPEGADEGLGYIVPWHLAALIPVNVYSFVEKPDLRSATKLINDGALWNTLIFSGSVRALLRLFEPEFSGEVAQFRAVLSEKMSYAERGKRLAELYEGLSSVDFSKAILEGKADAINVLRMPACGWNDLGTPYRLEQTARAHYSAAELTDDYLDLTRQFAKPSVQFRGPGRRAEDLKPPH